jgi:hypothetical protein
MQVPPQKPQTINENGFLQNTFNQMNTTMQKPVLWLVICIFLLMTGAGFWIGTTMVVKPAGLEYAFTSSGENSKTNTYLLLETDDLSLDAPQLMSIWFIHITTGDKSKLGFTPVVSIDMVDSENYSLLQKFSITADKQPNQEFLSLVAKKGFSSQNYLIIDQKSTAAFINWFAGKELSNPLALDKHSMTQYGPVLRGFCSSLSSVSERGLVDFPWSKITPGHFLTSLHFTRVISNLELLTSPKTSHCEMVPLP